MKRLSVLVLALAFSAGALAQAWPSVKPVRIIIPFGAGSSTDAVTRIIAPEVSALIGQQVIIDPKPGADGAIAASEVAKSAPDGYTLGVGSGGPMAAIPALRKNPPYDVNKDFTPITDIGRYTVFLYINSAVPAKNFQEFVAYVKANPGKVAYGTGNPSGIVAWAQLNSLTGMQMLHVPYKSAPLVMPDLLANRVQALIDPPTVAISHVRDGKLRALATTLNRRSPILPEVPTIHEVGVPQFTISNWMGLIGPANMPRELVDRINKAFGTALRKAEVMAGLEKQAFMANPSTPEQFQAFIQEQIQSYGSLLRAAGVQPD